MATAPLWANSAWAARTCKAESRASQVYEPPSCTKLLSLETSTVTASSTTEALEKQISGGFTDQEMLEFEERQQRILELQDGIEIKRAA
jgi:hypothetical protein